MIDEGANCDMDAVIITGDLDRRPSRAPDYEVESRAMTILAEAMSSSAGTVLQRLVEMAMELTRAASAGISLLEPGGDQGTFRWVATTGAWAAFRDGTMPREESPCGEVIAREAVLLMHRPERLFPSLLQAHPSIHEGLLAPFRLDGEPIGTIWAVKHDPGDRFEAEDARILKSLARFAAAAHQVVLARSGAEAGLQMSNSRFLALATASSEALYTISPDWSEMNVLSGGGFLADAIGPDRAWLMDNVPPEERPRLTEAIGEAIRTKSVFEREHRVHRRDGGVGWSLSRAVPILGAGGDIVEWFGASSDITERKLAEASLRDSESRQRFLLALSDELRSLDTPSQITRLAVQRLGSQLGVDRVFHGEIAGDLMKIDQDFTRDVPSLVGQHSLEKLGADYLASYRAGAVIAVGNVGTDERLNEGARTDLRGRQVAAFIDFVLFEDHRCVSILAVQSSTERNWSTAEENLVREVGERINSAIERSQAEAALRASEERFAQFSKASSSGIWIRDAESLAMEYVSPAVMAIYGEDADAILGDIRKWAAIIVPEDRDVALSRIQRAGRGESAIHEFRIQRPSDRAFRWIRNTYFPLHDNGHVQRIGGIFEDITDAKLAVGHQAVLLAELQHRVRNIMAMIRSIVARTGERAESVADYANLIGGRLLALARVQALLTRGVNFSVGIRSIVQNEVTVQAQHDGQYVFEGPDVALSPKAAEVLTLAVHELTTNALKYGALSTPEGRVAIHWTTMDTGGTTWVSFDWIEKGPLGNGGKPVDRRGFGSDLIEGRVPYELRGKGNLTIGAEGARCHLEFPLWDGASILETGAPESAILFGGALDMTGEADLTGHRVLVVEDDYYLATDTARALRGAGAEVIGPCPTEDAARREIDGTQPSVAVVDVNLGAGASFQLASALKGRNVPIVFVTGYDMEVIPSEFDGVARLQKPVDLRQIVSAVAKAVEAVV